MGSWNDYAYLQLPNKVSEGIVNKTKNKNMNVLSLFDGMSCGQIALNKLGIKYDNYFASEIKSHAIKVAQTNYPDTIQLGDINNWREWDIDWSSINLIIGGSPCQDLSQANKQRKGLNGFKSRLFYTFIDILNHVRLINPGVKFLLENVIMTKDNRDMISMLTDEEPININSKLFSAQLRNRLYWTNIKVDLDIKDKGILLNDILDSGYSEREKSRCLLESDSRPLTTPVKMFHRHQKFRTLVFADEKHYSACRDHYSKNFKGKSAKDIDLFTGDLSIYKGVRYLNRNESEKLQTVPVGYTECIPELDALCLLGDGWTVDVIAHIFKNLITNK